jgi:predicted permease
VVLLVAATTLFASLRHLLGLDAGFAPAGVVTATIFAPPSRYPDTTSFVALQDRVLERVRAIPGVAAAGMTSNIALSGFESPATVAAVGRTATSDPTLVPSVVAATPGYFEAMSTPIVRGRAFDEHDREASERVAIVDERLAERLWPGEDPLGKGLLRGDLGPFTIVGIVRGVRLAGLTGPADSIGTAYFPHTQAPPMRRLRWIAIRAAVEPATAIRAVRAAMLQVDRDLPIADVQTMGERTARSLAQERLATTLATMFAAVALFLSVLGIYAVLASVVARRTREIGIRMALGSSLRGIFRMVLLEGAGLIGAGLVIGLAGAVATRRLLDGIVFGVRPTDPLVLAAVGVATVGAGLLASVAPARRATRINAVEVLSEP